MRAFVFGLLSEGLQADHFVPSESRCGDDLSCSDALPGEEDLSLLQTKARPHTKVLPGGVPVYNYHLPYRSPHVAAAPGEGLALLSGGSAQGMRTDWVLALRPNMHHLTRMGICRKAKECRGTAAIGGKFFVFIRADDEELRRIVELPGNMIEYVEPDTMTEEVEDYPEVVPQQDDSVPWGLDRIDDRTEADGSYDERADAGAGVHVYLLDTGVRAHHDDLEMRASTDVQIIGKGVEVCRTVLGWSISTCGYDYRGHGTHMAAAIAGRRFGVAKGARLHSVKVLSDDLGHGDLSWVLQAFGWILGKRQRPAVVAMGLQAAGCFRYMRVAMEAVTRRGISVVVPAGNGDADAHGSTLASVEGTITVAAVASDGSRAGQHSGVATWASNYGFDVDLFAPGLAIPTASHSADEAVATASGTSMAAAQVAGAVAILHSDHTSWSVEEVKKCLLDCATEGAVTDAKEENYTPNRLLYVPVNYHMTSDVELTGVPAGRSCGGGDHWDASSVDSCKDQCMSTEWCKFVSWDHDIQDTETERCVAFRRCDELTGTSYETFAKLPVHAASLLSLRQSAGQRPEPVSHSFAAVLPDTQ